MNRAEHLAWCKRRAHEYIDAGDVRGAVQSIMSDLGKHNDTRQITTMPPVAWLSFDVMLSGDLDKARRFIDGFE